MPIDLTELQSPDAGRGVGVEFYGSVYPFVLPSTDVRGILSDFWLCHDDASATAPLRISELHHFGRPLGLEPEAPPGENPCDLVVVDANNDVVCDTRESESYTGRAFGVRFYVHEWRLGDRICRAVQHAKLKLTLTEDAPRELEGGDGRDTQSDEERLIEQLANPIPELLLPESAVLDERTHEKLPSRLLSVTVGGVTVRGNLVLRAGYNMQIGSNTSTGLSLPGLVSPGLLRGAGTSLRLTENRISLAIVPGGGDGLSPGCRGGEAGLRSINDVRPTTQGNFLLAGLACIDVSQPPLSGDPLELRPSSLQLGNHCSACCDCEDYVAAYKRLRRVHAQLQQSAALAEEVRDTYHRLMDRWLASKARCEALPIQVESLGAKFIRVYTADLSYQVTYVTISIGICNTTDDCLTDVEATLACTFAGGNSPASVILNGSNFQTTDTGEVITAAIGGGWPTYAVNWDRIATHQSVRAQFTISWSSETQDTPAGDFKVCATATAAGETLPLNGTQQQICDSTTIATQNF